MTPRRITHGLGAAAGGLLAAAFLPMTVANADTGLFGNLGNIFGLGSDATAPVTTAATGVDAFGFEAIPGEPENIAAVSGIPPLDQMTEGYQTLDFFSPTTATDPIGTVNTDVSTLTFPDGFTNTEYLVDSSARADVINPNLTVAPGTELPGHGSVYDIANFGFGFQNDYSDVVTTPTRFVDGTTDALTGTGTAATGTITDTFVTPFGSFDLTPFVDSFSTAVNPLDHFLFIPGALDPGIADPALSTALDTFLGIGAAF
jgi:hypothetical protein